jgi:hypothetical protein
LFCSPQLDEIFSLRTDKLSNRFTPVPSIIMEINNEVASPAQQYKHQPLDPEKAQIRLLRVEDLQMAGSGSDHINMKLEVFDLEDCPTYNTLSYMWGPPKPDREVFIDGCVFTIRENLWSFLSNLPMFRKLGIRDRLSDNSVNIRAFDRVPIFQDYFWIDQLCIQQSDSSERNQQVMMMGEIYQKSKEVLVWLGTDISSIHIHNLINADGFFDYSSAVANHYAEDLCYCQYWRRLWIIQEIMLGQKVTIFHNQQAISWRAFVIMVMDSIAIPKIVNSIIEERANFRCYGRSRSLSYILELFSPVDSECENPLDTVYGLQGLVDNSGTVEIDYDKSVEEVFFDVLGKVIHDEISMTKALVVEFSRLLQKSMNLQHIDDKKIYTFISMAKTREDQDWRVSCESSPKELKAEVDEEIEQVRQQLGTTSEDLEACFSQTRDIIFEELDAGVHLKLFELCERVTRKNIEDGQIDGVLSAIGIETRRTLSKCLQSNVVLPLNERHVDLDERDLGQHKRNVHWYRPMFRGKGMSELYDILEAEYWLTSSQAPLGAFNRGL